MKTLKLSIVAALFTVAVGGAALQHARAAAKLDPTFNWQQTDASGNVVIGGTYDANVSQAQAESDFGCAGSADPCATTVDSRDGSKTNQGTILHN